MKKDFFCFSKYQYFYLFFFLFICFFSYYYIDIEATTRHGINVWKSLFEGKFFQFYSYNANPSAFGIQFPALYEIPLYLIFAIWDFPLFIFELITKLNSLAYIPCILYSKGIIILFLYLNTRTFSEICDQLNFSLEKKKACTFFWISSIFVVESIFIICQYDVICLFFILNGILALLKNDTKKFLFWFSLSIPLKPYSLFFFLPLLVSQEKNILKIMLNLLLVSIPLIFCKLIFIADSAYSTLPHHMAIFYLLVDANTLDYPLFNSLNTFHFPLGNPTIFSTIYILFISFCYFFVNKTDYFLKLFISAISFSILMMFSFFDPYWAILISPFIALLCFYTNSKFTLYKNILLEFIFTSSFIYLFIQKFYWMFNHFPLIRLLFRYPFINITVTDEMLENSLSPFIMGTEYEIQNVLNIYEWITIPMITALYIVIFVVFYVHVFFDYKKPDLTVDKKILFDTLNPFFWIRTSLVGGISIAQIIFVIFSLLKNSLC